MPQISYIHIYLINWAPAIVCIHCWVELGFLMQIDYQTFIFYEFFFSEEKNEAFEMIVFFGLSQFFDRS